MQQQSKLHSDSSKDSLQGYLDQQKIYGEPNKQNLPHLPFVYTTFIKQWKQLCEDGKPTPDLFYDMFSKTIIIQKGLFFYILKSEELEPISYPSIMQIQMTKPVTNIVSVSVWLTFRTLALQTSSLLILFCTLTPTNKIVEARMQCSPSKQEILGMTFINHLMTNFLVVTRVGFDLVFLKEDTSQIIPIKSYSVPNTQIYWIELQTNTLLISCTIAKDTVIPFFLNKDPQQLKNIKGDKIVIGDNKDKSSLLKAFQFFAKNQSTIISPIPIRQCVYNKNLKFVKDEVEDDYRRAINRLAPFPHQIVLTTIYLDIVMLYHDPDQAKIHIYRLDVDRHLKQKSNIKVERNCIISIQVSQNLIIVHNITKKYSQIFDINGDKPTQSVTVRGLILEEKEEDKQNFEEKLTKDVEQQSKQVKLQENNKFHPYTPRPLFLENDIVIDFQNKKSYWYTFSVETFIKLCKSPVELIFLLLRRSNLKEFILQTILKSLQGQLSLGKLSRLFFKINQIYKKATIERNNRKKIQNQGGQVAQIQKPVQRMSTFTPTSRVGSIRISMSSSSILSTQNTDQNIASSQPAKKVPFSLYNIHQITLTNSGQIIIYLSEMNSEVFQKLVASGKVPVFYVLACLLQSQRCVLITDIPTVPSHQTLLVKFLVRKKEYEYLIKLIQLRVIKDTISLGQLLKQLGSPKRYIQNNSQDALGFYAPAFQLGLDIFHRLRKYDKIYEALIENYMLYDAIQYAQSCKEFTMEEIKQLAKQKGIPQTQLMRAYNQIQTMYANGQIPNIPGGVGGGVGGANLGGGMGRGGGVVPPTNPEQIDSEGGKMIKPLQGFVVKTRDTNGQKIFINMTMHQIIDPPQQKSIPDMEEDMGVRVPLSLGEPREDFDKSDKKCDKRSKLLVDASSAGFWLYLIEVQAQTQLKQVSTPTILQNIIEFVIPKMKYKGKSVQWQRVRAKKGPQIKEVSSTRLTPEEQRKQEEMLQSKANQMIKQTATVKENLVTPQWRLLVFQIQQQDQQQPFQSIEDEWSSFKINESQNKHFHEFNGYNLNSSSTKAIAIETKLPLLMRGSSIRVRISRLFLYVKVSPLYELKLCFPKLVQVEKAVSVNAERTVQLEMKAIFDCKDRKFLVFLPYEEKVEQIQGVVQKENKKEVKTSEINLEQGTMDNKDGQQQQSDEIDDLLIGAI